MITWAKHHFLLLLLLLFLATRLINLTLLPIFSDEANYLDWGWRGLHGVPFHSLYDAKQPLLMWLFGLGEEIFPDPLFGARFVSTLTGLASILAVYALAVRLFDKTTAYLSVLFYTFIPFFIFFDRQALMESSLTAVGLWTFYFLLKFFSRPRLLPALVIGVLLGLGFFIKTSAAVFILAFALIVLLGRSWKLLTLSLASAIAFLLVDSPLLFQSLFWSTFTRNSQYSFTLPELLHFPLLTWLTHLYINFQILLINFTPLVLLFILVGLIRIRLPRLYYYWLFIPLIIFSLTSRTAGYLSFRYLTPFIPLFIFPLAAYLKSRRILLILTLALPIIAAVTLIFSPVSYFQIKSRLTPYSYISDYVTGFDTGYQVNALVSRLDTLTGNQPSYIAMAVHAFNPEAALLAYYRKSSLLTPVFLDAKLFPADLSSRYDCLSVNQPLYFVAKLNDTAGLAKFLTPVTVVKNSYNPDYSTIYTLKTNCPPDRTANISPTQ